MPTLDQIARAAALIDWQNNKDELSDADWLTLQCVVGAFWTAEAYMHYGRIIRGMRERRMRIAPAKD